MMQLPHQSLPAGAFKIQSVAGKVSVLNSSGTPDRHVATRASTARHQQNSGFTTPGPVPTRSCNAIWTYAPIGRRCLHGSDAADLIYKQTVQLAFADVSNSLVGYRQSRLYGMKLQEQTATYKETSRLANVRFAGGATSYLEVLTTQQQYFTSELQTTQAWFTELQNYVQLYQALCGGW